MNAHFRAEYQTVTSLDQLDRIIKDAWREGVLSFDLETTSLDFMSADIVGVALAVHPGMAFYAPVGHADGENLPLQDVLDLLKPALEHPMLTKVGQHIKYDMAVIARYGIELNGNAVEDTMLMSYSLYGGKHRHGMDDLALMYLQHSTIKYKEVAGSGTFDLVPIDRATAYAAEDADVTLRLAHLFRSHLDENPKPAAIYNNLERPLIGVVSRMERRGITVDEGRLDELTEDFTNRRNAALDRIEDLVGHPINPASPQQVGAVLERMGANLEGQTPSGQIATGVEELTAALDSGTLPADAATLVQELLEWRKYAKLIGTYTEGLKQHINPQTNRVHPSFGMAHTSTGRLACSDPNLQNIPIRTDEGRLIRSAFIASPGRKLIAADYSQVELRILAVASQDPALYAAFESGVDFHKLTAADMYAIPFDDVTPMQRRSAKAINFGIVYGLTRYGLSRDLKITQDAAQAMIDRYFETYPGVKTYIDMAIGFARKHGYVETIAGRRIWIPDINAPNWGKRGHAERLAQNAPIQGTAADVIKAAMLTVDELLTERGFKTRMLLQVHDELIFEAPDEEVDEVLPEIKRWMEQAVDYLDVPLIVDAHAAQNWMEAK